MLEHLAPDETVIDAREGIHEAFEDGFQLGDELRKLRQGATAAQGLGVVDHRLDAKHPFAFGVDLQRQACRSAA